MIVNPCGFNLVMHNDLNQTLFLSGECVVRCGSRDKHSKNIHSRDIGLFSSCSQHLFFNFMLGDGEGKATSKLFIRAPRTMNHYIRSFGTFWHFERVTNIRTWIKSH